jgi:hypothetical protein
MSSPKLSSTVRRVGFAGAVLIVTASFAYAQATELQHQPVAAGSSSSSDPRLPQIAELAAPNGLAALPSSPVPSASQDRGTYGGGGGGWRQTAMSRMAFEIGGGGNAPTPDERDLTWGGNFTVGAGVNFSKRFAMLAEYQFISNKLPGFLIAEAGATGGHAHIWSLTLDPVVSLFPNSSNDIYLTGGGGFYRKVTSFTDPTIGTYCDYYYGCYGVTVNQVVGHFSSNQGGWNIGAGYQHRMGGMYGESKMKFFAEARYLDVLTPAVTTQPNGLGTTTVQADTKLIPVTIGLRW